MVREIKSNEYRKVIITKLRFQGVFRPLEIKKLAFSHSSGLNSVFEDLRFRD